MVAEWPILRCRLVWFVPGLSVYCSQLPMWPPTRFRWPSSCSVCAVWVVGEAGVAVENAVARVCREGGACVSTNVMVRDLDVLAP